jgi:hypothetical protein
MEFQKQVIINAPADKVWTSVAVGLVPTPNGKV